MAMFISAMVCLVIIGVSIMSADKRNKRMIETKGYSIPSVWWYLMNYNMIYFAAASIVMSLIFLKEVQSEFIIGKCVSIAFGYYCLNRTKVAMAIMEVIYSIIILCVLTVIAVGIAKGEPSVLAMVVFLIYPLCMMKYIRNRWNDFPEKAKTQSELQAV